MPRRATSCLSPPSRGMEDGTMPLGTSQYEKRGIATHLPVWDAAECLQCNHVLAMSARTR